MTDLATIANFPIVIRFSDEPIEPDWYLFNAPRPLSGDGEWEGDWLAGTFYASVNPFAPDADRHIHNNRDAHARVVVSVSREQSRESVDRYYRRVLPGDFNAETLGLVLAELARLDDVRVAEILVSIACEWTYADAMKEIHPV